MGGNERAVFIVVLKDGRSDVSCTLQGLQILIHKYIRGPLYRNTADLQRWT
jgi:hypothetical protein